MKREGIVQTNPDKGSTYKIQAGDMLWQIAQRFQTSLQAIMAENPTLDENNLQAGQVIRIPPKSKFHTRQQEQESKNSAEFAQSLRDQFRMLWEQHVYWTRMVILGIVFGLPDTQASINRLLRNPLGIAAILKKFFKAPIVADFVKLFTEHLTIAAELVKAAKAKDSTAAVDAERRWYENADQIAKILASMNPFWSEQEWKYLLYNHLAMTKQEVVDLLTKNYVESINEFDRIELEALKMADEMTNGIVKLLEQI